MSDHQSLTERYFFGREVSWCKPGAAAAAANLEDFLTSRLRLFESKRNDPTVAALSNVSPWLHYGQISAQRCALAAKQHSKSHGSSVASFVEELVVRREVLLSPRSLAGVHHCRCTSLHVSSHVLDDRLIAHVDSSHALDVRLIALVVHSWRITSATTTTATTTCT